MEVLTFKIENDVVVADKMNISNRYYLPDVFGEHFKNEINLKLGTNFACSILITQILSAGLGEKIYTELVKEAGKNIRA